MKKFILILTGAALLFAGCTKEVDQEVVPAEGKRVVTLKATINDTNTRINLNSEGKYSWQSGDKIAVMVSNGTTQTCVMSETSGSGATADFPVELEEGEELGAYAFYPYADDYLLEGFEPKFYLSDGLDYEEGVPNIPMLGTISQDGVSFSAVCGGLKLTINNVPSNATSLVFFVDDISITGEFSIHNGVITTDGQESNCQVVIDFKNQWKSTMEFFIPLPTGTYNGFGLTFMTADADDIGTRTTNATLVVDRNKIIVAPELNWGSAVSNKYYVKVTSDEGLMNGTYLIVYEGGTSNGNQVPAVAFNGSLETLDAINNGVAVTIADNKILSTTTLNESAFSISIDDGTIQSTSGVYVGVDAYSNGLATSDEPYVHSISIDNTGHAQIALPFAEDNMTLKYNHASGQLRFRYYKSGQQSIALYLLDDGSATAPSVKQDPELSFDETEFSAETDTDFDAPTLNNPHNLPVTWSSSDEDIAAVVDDDGNVLIGSKPGTVTITASFAGDETYRKASVYYTIVVTAPPVSYVWVESALADLTADDVFAIVGLKNDNYYAMSNDKGTSAAPLAVAVSVSGSVLQGEVADNIQWKVSGDATNGYTFYPNGSTTTWLYCTNTNNGVRVGNNENKTFVIESGYLKHSATSRYVGIYVDSNNTNTKDWRCYTTINANIEYESFAFYKRIVDDGKADAGVSLTYSGDVTFGDSPVQFTLTNPNSVSLSCASSNTDVATVTNAGLVTIVGAGTATITASWPEQTIGETTYREGSSSYTLTVKKADVTVTFTNPNTEVDVNGTVTNVATVTPAGLPLTYSSSDTDIATVTSAGVVTGVANGIVTITASFPGNDNYNSASASYSITVGEVHDGSLEHPYTVSEALAIISGYSHKQKSESEVYVSGKVANVGEYSSQYHSVTYDISDDGQNTNTLTIYSGKFVSNTAFSSNTQIAVNDAVIVYGYLYLYNSTKEMYQNNYIYSLNGVSKALTAGSLQATTNDANKQITVTWGAATGTDSAISYVITCGTQTYNANAAGSHTFTMADYGTYDISVVASATDAFSATATTSATLTNPTIQSVTYDFTGSGWTVSNGTLSNGEVSFTGAGEANFKMNTGYFILGKNNAYINFPAYSAPVTKIVVTGREGASGSVKQNIFVGTTAVSTETTGATGTNTYLIASDHQAAGTIYTLKVTSNHNTQITKIEVFFN